VIFAAGLDVTDPEPPEPNSELLRVPNLVVAPHIASATVGTRNSAGADGGIVAQSTHRLPHAFLTLLAGGQALGGLPANRPGHLVRDLPIRCPTRPPGLLLILLLATLFSCDMRLGMLEFLAGSLGLPVQRQRRGPRQLLLAVEKVGAVLGVQAVLGAGDQTLGLPPSPFG
jgi:hypothetical protein